MIPIRPLHSPEVKILPTFRDLAAGRKHADYPVPGKWYRTDMGVQWRLVGDWQWIRDFAGAADEGEWFSGEIELKDGSRCIAEIRLDTCKPVPWWRRVFE